MRAHTACLWLPSQLVCHLIFSCILHAFIPRSSLTCHWIVIVTSAASLWRPEFHLGGCYGESRLAAPRAVPGAQGFHHSCTRNHNLDHKTFNEEHEPTAPSHLPLWSTAYRQTLTISDHNTAKSLVAQKHMEIFFIVRRSAVALLPESERDGTGWTGACHATVHVLPSWT